MSPGPSFSRADRSRRLPRPPDPASQRPDSAAGIRRRLGARSLVSGQHDEASRVGSHTLVLVDAQLQHVGAPEHGALASEADRPVLVAGPLPPFDPSLIRRRTASLRPTRSWSSSLILPSRSMTPGAVAEGARATEVSDNCWSVSWRPAPARRAAAPAAAPRTVSAARRRQRRSRRSPTQDGAACGPACRSRSHRGGS